MLEVEREEVEAAPLRHARAGRSGYDAVVLLKGRRTRRRPARRPGARQHHRRAVAGDCRAGDVLAGIVGALLAAGLAPVRRRERRRVAARRGRDPLPRSGGPLTALWRRARRGPPARADSLTATDPAERMAPMPRTPRSSSTSPRSGTTCGSSPTWSAPAAVMAVVKADGYGHGMVRGRPRRPRGRRRMARRGHARRGARPARVRRHRPAAVLAHRPGRGVRRRLAVGDVDVTAYSVDRARRDRRRRARAGRRRASSSRPTPGCPAAARRWPTGRPWSRERAGSRPTAGRITGVWSHFACSDEPDHPANDAQEALFAEALAVAEEAGLRPEVRHLANSAAAMLRPSSRYDLVRCRLAAYGLDPAPGRPPTSACGRR